MSPEMQQLVFSLKNVKDPFTLAFLAVLVGGIVRVLKTKTVGDFLDWIPSRFVKRIPKDKLPWVAVMLGAVIVFADGKLNGGLGWREAAWHALLGAVLSGGAAIGGNETLGRLLKTLISAPPDNSKPGDKPDDPKPPLDSPPPAGAARMMLLPRWFAFGGMVRSSSVLILILGMAGCAFFGQGPKAVTKSVLSVADVVCLETGEGALVTDAKEAALACKMVDKLSDIAPELIDVIVNLIGQREAGKKAGYHWSPPGVVETVAKPKDAGGDAK